MGFLRERRTIWRRTEGHPELWHDDQAQLVVYELGYQATGWRTTGDAILANTAAADAREYAETARLELQQPYTTPAVASPVAA
jgi:hypothetical protein